MVRFAQVEKEMTSQDGSHSVGCMFMDDSVSRKGLTTYGLAAMVAMLPREMPTEDATWKSVVRTKGCLRWTRAERGAYRGKDDIEDVHDGDHAGIGSAIGAISNS